MFIHPEGLTRLARVRQMELIEEAKEERQAREVIPMRKHADHTNRNRRLGHRLIQWIYRLFHPEPTMRLVPARVILHQSHGTHYPSGQARRKIVKPPTPVSRLPLYLLTRVTSEIEIETTQFGHYYLTYYRSPHRVAALERYHSETAAREGHHKWASKSWSTKSFSEVVLSEA